MSRLNYTKVREALEDSQTLLVAMLSEKRPDAEIEKQIAENRNALTPGFFDSADSIRTRAED